jgi:ubiquitin-protein ligase
MNLDILKINKWLSTITLEQLIIEIAKIDFNQYIIYNNYDTLEYELIKLLSITHDNITSLNNNINIDINIINIKKNNTDNNFWKSGTGYSLNNTTNWDINGYLNDQKILNNNINEILVNINDILIDNPNNKYVNILLEFINIKIKSLTLLELNNNITFYKNIFTILYILYNHISQDNISIIANNIKDIYNELDILQNNSSIELDDYIIKIYNSIKLYYNTIHTINNNNIIEDNYINIMKELQYDTFELPSYHLFYNTKNVTTNKKSIIRIMSEISSLKTTLPLSNDSSIWIRISEDNFNIITFLISGPKNTPYENGLFEFHCCLPHNYPIEPPKVLLHTTGNNTFRFNPNLYECGKICLSLLGTWESTIDEKWNPTTSTLLQVLVSIQSLIFIDFPYFNEPGYEKRINTELGIKESTYYNNKIYPNTVKLAMINMIKNPPKGFEYVINNHFKFKKNDIINTVTKWKELNNIVNLNELIELLN